MDSIYAVMNWALPSSDKLVLVLDLDGTLVHQRSSVYGQLLPNTEKDEKEINSTMILSSRDLPGCEEDFHRIVEIRTDVFEFFNHLKKLDPKPDVLVWSLSHVDVARLIVDQLDSEKVLIKGVIGREYPCLKVYCRDTGKSMQIWPNFDWTQQMYKHMPILTDCLRKQLQVPLLSSRDPHIFKDLTLLGTSLHQTLLIDDTFCMAFFQPGNILHVEQFQPQTHDEHLTTEILSHIRFFHKRLSSTQITNQDKRNRQTMEWGITNSHLTHISCKELLLFCDSFPEIFVDFTLFSQYARPWAYRYCLSQKENEQDTEEKILERV